MRTITIMFRNGSKISLKGTAIVASGAQAGGAFILVAGEAAGKYNAIFPPEALAGVWFTDAVEPQPE
jgi:hypothetical protein